VSFSCSGGGINYSVSIINNGGEQLVYMDKEVSEKLGIDFCLVV